MSDIKWYPDEVGIYSRMRHGKEVFHVRVWAPALRKMIYSKAGGMILQARRKLVKIREEPEAFIKKRNTRPATSITFKELVTRFLAGYQSRGDSGYYEMVSVSWIAHFGKVAADRMTRAMVEDYRDTLRRAEYGDSTILKYVGALGTMYRWAIGRGLLSVNPVQDVKRPAEPDREVAVLSLDEETALLKATERDDRAVVRLFIESGMRLSEGLSLRWSQVDRAGGAILIN